MTRWSSGHSALRRMREFVRNDARWGLASFGSLAFLELIVKAKPRQRRLVSRSLLTTTRSPKREGYEPDTDRGARDGVVGLSRF